MFRSPWAPFLAALAFASLVGCAPASEHRDTEPVTVFAAASLTDVLTEIAADFERAGGAPVRLSFGASGAVARQIQSGAPADVVILADPAWMDRLAEAGRLGDRRIDLLRNRLVLIAPAGEATPTSDPFLALAEGGRLAIGDPESVPAGTYGRAWLQGVGRWDAVRDHLVFASDVRSVRAFVARGEARLGIVYRSDVTGQDEVRVVLEPPPEQQPEILYPAAEVADAGPEADAFLDYLRTPRAVSTFRRHGFEPAG